MPSGFVTPAAGGGSPPITRAEYNGSTAATVGNTSTGALPIDTKVSGTALLSVTNPLAPTIVTAGVYALTLRIQPWTEVTVGGFYLARLLLDVGGDNKTVTANSAPSVAANPGPEILISSTYHLPAGAEINVLVTNHDGAAAVDFNVANMLMQRVS